MRSLLRGVVVLALLLTGCEPEPASDRQRSRFESAYRAAQELVRAHEGTDVAFAPIPATVMVDQTGEGRWTMTAGPVRIDFHDSRATVRAPCTIGQEQATFTARLREKDGEHRPADDDTVGSLEVTRNP